MSARIALSFALVAALAGAAQAQTSHLIGQVSYPDRVQLGKTAVLEVTLEDVSNATAPGIVIATMRMPRPGQTPVIFSLEFDAARVKPAGRYALRAHIVDAGATVLESATPVRVLTQGAGAMASVTLVQVDPKPAAPSPLPAVASAKAGAPEPKSTPAPKPLPAEASAKAGTPAPKPTPTPKPLPAVASAKAGTPAPKTAPPPKPKPEPKSTPAPKPLPEPKVTPTPKPLPAEASAKAGKPEPKSTPAPKPLPEPKLTPAPKPTPAPKAAAEPTAKPAPVPKSTPTSAPPAPSTAVASGAAALSGTTWTIVEIHGKPVGAVDKDHQKFVLAFDANRGTYSGASGCSDLAGRFVKNGARLTPTADNSAQVCHVDEQTERAMRSVIQDIRGHRVSGATLELLDAKGARLAKLER